MVDQEAFDGLYNALGLTVNEYALDAEEGFFDATRVVYVYVIVKVFDEHVCEAWVLIC